MAIYLGYIPPEFITDEVAAEGLEVLITVVKEISPTVAVRPGREQRWLRWSPQFETQEEGGDPSG